MVRSRGECGPIPRTHRGLEKRGDAPIALFLAALAPPAVAFPLRFLFFPDGSPITILLLGPAVEEGLKLSALFLALIVAGLVLPRGTDPENALRYWLFLLPWSVGGLYGMMEGFLVYAGQSSLDFTLREFAHGAFTALALAAALWVWQVLDAPYVGVGLGFGAGWCAHFLFNGMAFASSYVDVTFTDQAALALGIGLLAAIALIRVIRREPASRESIGFLRIRGGLRT